MIINLIIAICSLKRLMSNYKTHLLRTTARERMCFLLRMIMFRWRRGRAKRGFDIENRTHKYHIQYQFTFNAIATKDVIAHFMLKGALKYFVKEFNYRDKMKLYMRNTYSRIEYIQKTMRK